jgi:hypothetical protein
MRDGYMNENAYTAEAGYTFVLNNNGAIYGALGVSRLGLRCVADGSDFWQLELYSRGYFRPLRFGVFALEPNMGVAFGIKSLPKVEANDSGIRFGMSGNAGIEFTSSVISGLYIGSYYHYNLYTKKDDDKNNTRHFFIIMAGYRFGDK